MVRASGLPDGMTAPVESGLSIHERMKRTSSSKRRFFFATLNVDWNIGRIDTQNRHAPVTIVKSWLHRGQGRVEMKAHECALAAGMGAKVRYRTQQEKLA